MAQWAEEGETGGTKYIMKWIKNYNSLLRVPFFLHYYFFKILFLIILVHKKIFNEFIFIILADLVSF